MMKFKQLLKRSISRLFALIYNVKYRKGVYIGLSVKLVGGGKIRLMEYAQIMPSTMIVSNGGVIEVGRQSEIGMYSRIASVGKVVIEDNVITGPHVFIADYNHEYNDPCKPVKYQGNRFCKRPDGTANVIVGEGSWIGTNAVIVGNVHIGKHCVIGANSVVTKDIPDYCVVAGIPAKVIKQYSFNTNKWERV